MAKSKKRQYSKVGAAKAMARATVGTPPPERILPDPKKKRAATRSRPTLAQLLTPTDDEGAPR